MEWLCSLCQHPRLLDASIVGSGAGEHSNELALVLMQPIGLAQLALTTHVYPTLALGVQQVAGQYALEQAAHNRSVQLLRGLAR